LGLILGILGIISDFGIFPKLIFFGQNFSLISKAGLPFYPGKKVPFWTQKFKDFKETWKVTLFSWFPLFSQTNLVLEPKD